MGLVIRTVSLFERVNKLLITIIFEYKEKSPYIFALVIIITNPL